MTTEQQKAMAYRSVIQCLHNMGINYNLSPEEKTELLTRILKERKG